MMRQPRRSEMGNRSRRKRAKGTKNPRRRKKSGGKQTRRARKIEGKVKAKAETTFQQQRFSSKSSRSSLSDGRELATDGDEAEGGGDGRNARQRVAGEEGSQGGQRRRVRWARGAWTAMAYPDGLVALAPLNVFVV